MRTFDGRRKGERMKERGRGHLKGKMARREMLVKMRETEVEEGCRNDRRGEVRRGNR